MKLCSALMRLVMRLNARFYLLMLFFGSSFQLILFGLFLCPKQIKNSIFRCKKKTKECCVSFDDMTYIYLAFVRQTLIHNVSQYEYYFCLITNTLSKLLRGAQRKKV